MNRDNPSISRPENKDLIHWCHGAGGVIFLLAKAYLFWQDERYLNACKRCGDLIWQRGLLKKGPGICHGVGGHGLCHLLLFRLTKDVKYLYRASKFFEFLNTQEFKTQARTPDRPFSLFEGLAGTVCFAIEILDPHNSEYPLMPVF
jgi:membrane transport protein XK